MKYQHRTARRNPRAGSRPLPALVAAEALENRRLLSASLSGRTLVVTGTDATDFVTFGVFNGTRLEVFIGGQSQGRFRLDQFDRVQANLLGGPDIIQPSTLKPLIADMGTGGEDPAGAKDRVEISGTSGNDAIDVTPARVSVGAQTYDFTNNEEVTINGGQGDDTLRLLPPVGTTTPPALSVTFFGFDGTDVVDTLAPSWNGDVYFDGGNGDDRMNATAYTRYTFQAGAGTNDVLRITSSDQSDLTSMNGNSTDLRLLNADGTYTLVRPVSHDAVERLDFVLGPSGAATGAAHVVDVVTEASSDPTPAPALRNITGSADADEVRVTGHASPALVTIAFSGNGGDDSLLMDPNARLTATFDGGAGANDLAFGGTDGNDVIDADGDSVNDTRSRIDFTNVASADVRGLGGYDTFRLVASPAVSFRVRGDGAPSLNPGDRLTVNRNGGTPASLTYTSPPSRRDGQVTFTDRGTIAFEGIDLITGLEDVKPLANPGGPYEVVEGKSVQLDGSGSRPFEGSIVSYSWDFNYDGTTFTSDATGVRPTFSAYNLNVPLVRTIALRVTDQGGRTSAVTTTTVTVTPTQRPVANPNGPYEVFENQYIDFSAAGSYDPDGYIANYEWDLDYDGVTFNADRFGQQPEFRLTDLTSDVVRTIALRVIDDSRVASAVATTTLTVKASPPPTVDPHGPIRAYEGSPFQPWATGVAGGGDSIVRFEWDFDYDGVNFESQVVQPSYADPTIFSVQYGWDGPSTRNAAVRVVTSQGQTALATTTVQVLNIAPLPTISGPATVDEGAPYTLSLNDGQDWSIDPVTSWQIDWGDGVVETIAGNPTSASHAYADGPAQRVITATMTDEDGTYAAPGAIKVDVSFGGGDGWMTSHFGSSEMIEELLPLADGRFIAVGAGTNRVVAARYAADGTLDTTFGTGGSTTTPFPGSTYVYDALLQPDGKILVAGSHHNSATNRFNLIVLRYNADGTPDGSFGTNGVLTRTFTGGSAEAKALALLSDGRILVGADTPVLWTNESGTSYYSSTFTLLGLNPDGTPDTTFGTDGIANPLLPNSSWAHVDGVHLQTDGSILVVGTNSYDVVIATFSAAGQLQDVQFRDNSYSGSPIGMAFPDDETVVIAESYRVARYNLRTPRADRLFDYATNHSLTDVIAYPDGSVLAAGYPTGSTFGSITLTRFTARGDLDESFAPNGQVALPISNVRVIKSMAVAADGGILVGGARWTTTSGTESDFLVGRFFRPSTVSVRNVPPVISVQVPPAAQAGTPLSITFAADDAVTSWRVDWGDGTIDTLPGDATGATNTYTRGGTRQVRVSAFDDEGGPYDAPHASVAVANPAPWLGADGVLHVWTGDNVDDVELALADAGALLRATVNGAAFDFNRAAVTAIDVQAFAAADAVRIGGGVPTGAVHLGGQSTAETLAVSGPLAGEAPLAVESFSSSTFTFAPGVKASLSTHGFGVQVLLSGTEGDDAWTLGLNGLSGAGNAITWTGGPAFVRIDALGGDDRFDADTSGQTSTRPGYTLMGGAGRDTARLLGGFFASTGSPVGVTGGFVFNGGDDVDTLEVVGTSTLGGTAGFAGDAGDDVLVFNARDNADDFISVSAINVRRSDVASVGSNSFAISGANRTTNPIPWEVARVYGLGGNDVLGTTSGPHAPTTLLDGGAGDDQFRVGNDAPMPATTPVELRGGDGTDSAIVQGPFSSSTPTTRSYVLDDTGVRYDSNARHTFDAIEAVTLHAGNSADTITVTPGAATAFTVNASTHNTGTGDRLRINLAGATGATLTPGTTGAGTYTFANRQPVNYTGVEDAQEFTAPRVTAMFVASTAWTIGYRDSLKVHHPGSEEAFGYRIGTADRTRPLAWSNLNQISIRFSEHVNVAADDFVLNGINLAAYGLALSGGFQYDPVTFTATWTLDRFIPNDKVTVRLDAAEGTGITDASGNLLDGEPNQAVTHMALFPSGDGVAGGNFALAVRVLPGDLTGDGAVNLYDYNVLRVNLNLTGKGVTGGDINGDGVVNLLDLNDLRAYMNKTTPV